MAYSDEMEYRLAQALRREAEAKEQAVQAQCELIAEDIEQGNCGLGSIHYFVVIRQPGEDRILAQDLGPEAAANVYAMLSMPWHNKGREALASGFEAVVYRAAWGVDRDVTLGIERIALENSRS